MSAQDAVSRPERRYLVAVYDVSRLTEEEREGLAGEVHAQAEDSDLHPSVEVETAELDEGKAETLLGITAFLPLE